MSEIRVKICGLTKPEDMAAVAKAQAGYAGLVFFPKSPRNVDLETARSIALIAPLGVAKVALVVNPDDDLLDRIFDAVPLDMIQLHGSESPERVRAVKARYGLPVMKAVGVSCEDDLPKIGLFAQVADQILVDAKPGTDADLPGGNGLSFDWRLVAGKRWAKPWMLAGGLTPDNVQRAIEMTGARQVDVSSGVEAAPGVKDADKIAAFTQAARRAGTIPKL